MADDARERGEAARKETGSLSQRAEPLSERQEELLVLLANWSGQPPRLSLLAQQLNLSNESSVRRVLEPLVQRGLVERVSQGAGLPKPPRLTDAGRAYLGLLPEPEVLLIVNRPLSQPLPVNPVSCGTFTETATEPSFFIEHLGDVFGNFRQGDYLLVAKGDSMVSPHGRDESILEGDRCLCRPGVWPGNGELVFVEYALHNGLHECTLKEFYVDEHSGLVRLKPRNPAYPVIERRADEIIVRGVVLEIVRSTRPRGGRPVGIEHSNGPLQNRTGADVHHNGAALCKEQVEQGIAGEHGPP